MSRENLYRILDANLNRSREGLRVCEEITRFVLEDPKLTRKLKKARHAVSQSILKLSAPALLKSRDSAEDVGKESSRLEKKRQGALGLFTANIQRSKEALRVLEETSKLAGGKLAPVFKKIRFDVYELEKEIAPRLEALCHHDVHEGHAPPPAGDRRESHKRGRGRRPAS